MDREFYTISVYVDKDENLVGIPCGESDKYGIADIDTVMLLKAPYTAKQVESYIEKVIDACYTKKHNDDVETSTIERYTKKKGFVKACEDFMLISIVKMQTGYSLMPTFYDYEKGPLAIDDDERILPIQYNEGELADIIHDFIEVYLKANMFYKEIKELEEEKRTEN
ncbi:MAG: hypothetical protein E7520_00365 [Ruminococcaceae bacterium]|nr:hypothetical protein [Oscillospiraceae bacterium]